MKYLKTFENTDKNERFLRLCYFDNNYSEIKRQVKIGNIDVNFADIDNYTPLLVAIGNSNFDICLLLLENGANPNVIPKSKGTFECDFFMISVISDAILINSQIDSMQKRYWNFFNEIFKYDIDFNLQTPITKSTVLIKMSYCAKPLLNVKSQKNGIEHHCSNIDDNNLIYMFKKILNSRPDIYLKNSSGKTFIDILFDNQRTDIVEILSNEFEYVSLYIQENKYNL